MILATNLLILERLGPTTNGDGADAVIAYTDLPAAREALQYGYELDYDELPLHFHKEPISVETSHEVCDILRMYDTLKSAYDDSEDKQDLTEEELRCPGWDYDGGESGHWNYSRYIIETRGLYARVVGRDDTRSMVSHHDEYRAMYATFSELPQHAITIEGIKRVLAAGAARR